MSARSLYLAEIVPAFLGGETIGTAITLLISEAPYGPYREAGELGTTPRPSRSGLAHLRRRSIRWVITFALALPAVSVALMLTDGSLQHRCVHVTDAIDLGGHCGSVP